MRVGDSTTFGQYKWRVLDVKSGEALLITEDMIGQRSFHNRSGGTTWAECELRAYLNGEFYASFSEADRARIVPVTNRNPDNPWYGSSGGEDTRDRVFLLSIEEAVCQYFGDSSKNLENRSAKQRYWFQKKDENNIKRSSFFDGHSWWWWLRSPGRDNKRAVYVWGNGVIGIQGNGTFRYNSNTLHPTTGDNCGGVRPALWLALEDSSAD